MIAVEKARAMILERVPPPEIETLPLAAAGRRVLGEVIRAPFPQPRFTNTAMDGFAVRSQDTAGASRDAPVELELVGPGPAGQAAGVEIKAGQCSQCMTGAPLPPGADAIVIVEDSDGFAERRKVQIYHPASRGDHLRQVGEEIQKGQLLIPKGTWISPAETAVLATFGYSAVPVYKSPRVALLATGDELVEPGVELEPGQIYNSNLYLLAELVERSGARVVSREVAADNPAALKRFLEAALEASDMVVTTGGVSMGRYDYVRDIFLELGLREHFWKVAQKPGKPLFFASRGSQLVFGLPGNPVSAFIVFMEYVWPALETGMGRSPAPAQEAVLKVAFPRDEQKHRFLFGRAWIEKERLVCTPSKKVGSHMLTASLNANCILGAEAGRGPLKKGSRIAVRLLPWKGVPGECSAAEK